jgi:chemotaxis protein methyltransferase CheR
MGRGGVKVRDRHAAAASLRDDATFQALKALIISRTGHHYYTDKDDQLYERLVLRMEATGRPSIAAYRELLEATQDGSAEWRRLESAITINETFFFRFAEQFDLLRRTVLPRLIDRAREERRLRIWSVGCSIGAEPYSLAVLIDDLLGSELPDWRISITGTDLDEAALTAARAARYSAWAMRTLGAAERERLFDREGEAYRLKARYRGLVRFEQHNMLSLLDPANALQFTGYDLILCRNVLIYFSQNVAKKMVGALAERLTRDGYLLLGHAEPNPDFAEVSRLDEIEGILTYRRRDAAVPDLPLPATPAPPPLALTPPRKPLPPRQSPTPPRSIPAQTPPPQAANALDELRNRLALGDAAEAVELAGREAGRALNDPVPHYLAALGALALGDNARAEQGFRKALYLDNRFAMAHYMLGRHLLAQGRDDEGRRALGNAVRATAALDPAAQLPEGDGMTAGSLIAAARSTLA